jgi:hypothetical protein
VLVISGALWCRWWCGSTWALEPGIELTLIGSSLNGTVSRPG